MKKKREMAVVNIRHYPTTRGMLKEMSDIDGQTLARFSHDLALKEYKKRGLTKLLKISE